MFQAFLRYLLHNQVLLALFLVALFWFLYQIQDILLTLFIAYILMAALSSPVDSLIRKKIPPMLAIAIVYFIFVGFLLLLIIPLIPFLISQLELLVASFPKYAEVAAKTLKLSTDSAQIGNFFTSELGNISRNAIDITGKVFGSLFSVLTIFVVSFYLLVDRKRIKNTIASFFPESSERKVEEISTLVNEKLGAWLRGQIVLSIFIGAISWIALTILAIPFALPLAVLAGILEIVPTLGPILSAVPAAIVAISISPTMVVIVIVVYFGIQMLENNILVPKIMEHAVGLNPIAIIIGVLVGSRLFGILGALLSVPFISMVIIIFSTIQKKSD